MIRKEMNSDRKTAIVVGVLFITATVAGLLSEVFGPNLDAPDYLANLSANGNQVLIGALLVFTMAVLIAGIPIFMYPILKKYNEALALEYVVFRTIEVVFFIVCAISLLTLLPLSQEFVIAGTPDASYFQTLATLLLAVREWGGPLILLSGASFLKVFSPEQLDALVMLFLNLYNYGIIMIDVFWGLWLYPLGSYRGLQYNEFRIGEISGSR